MAKGSLAFIRILIIASVLLAVLIAGLIAEGTTEIDSCEYILRGYGNVVEKLQAIGADVKIVE